MIIFGMAGMAGIVGIGVFIISEKKRKKDVGQGQTGIDPSKLRASGTNASAGGYQTNRGESYVVGEEYTQHRSVYDNPQVEEKTAPVEEKKESSRGSLPKGWKP